MLVQQCPWSQNFRALEQLPDNGHERTKVQSSRVEMNDMYPVYYARPTASRCSVQTFEELVYVITFCYVLLTFLFVFLLHLFSKKNLR